MVRFPSTSWKLLLRRRKDEWRILPRVLLSSLQFTSKCLMNEKTFHSNSFSEEKRDFKMNRSIRLNQIADQDMISESKIVNEWHEWSLTLSHIRLTSFERFFSSEKKTFLYAKISIAKTSSNHLSRCCLSPIVLVCFFFCLCKREWENCDVSDTNRRQEWKWIIVQTMIPRREHLPSDTIFSDHLMEGNSFDVQWKE